MAGDWIKMRCDLFTHPKVVRISSALKADTLRTIGGLMSVWCLFDAHSIDGNLEGYEPQNLDTHLRWDGFSAAMMSVQWLEYNPAAGLFLPRFDSHNGQSAKRRAQDADRKKDVRKESASEADKKETKSGPEKRREEKSNTEGKPSVARSSKRCPASFEVTAELMDWSTEKCPLVAQALETETFRDYTFNRAISDWDGAWRNWMRKSQKDAEARTQKAQQGTETSYQRSMREKFEVVAPSIAAKAPGAIRVGNPNDFFDNLPRRTQLEIANG
jgi:hypothetical protein